MSPITGDAGNTYVFPELFIFISAGGKLSSAGLQLEKHKPQREALLSTQRGARLSEQCQSEALMPTDAASHVHIKGGVLEIVSDAPEGKEEPQLQRELIRQASWCRHTYLHQRTADEGPLCFFPLSLSLTLSFSFSGVLPFCQTCRGSHWRANFLTQWVRGRSACRNPHDDHLEAGEPLQPTPYTQSSFCSSIPPQNTGLSALPALGVMTLLGETLGPLQGVSYPLQGVLSLAW
ncbi:unnamed protein product [Leuciscus chuanchicus]